MKKKKKQHTAYYRNTDSDYHAFCTRLNALTKNRILPHQTPVILCIGSDRITGDCLGPLTGHYLKQYLPECGQIFGCLKEPVHAQNMTQMLSKIRQLHAFPFFIAVDASLGAPGQIGCISLSDYPISPGEGVKKSLPLVGDISITGVVSTYEGDSMAHLQNTRLGLVHELSLFIAKAVAGCFYPYFL